MIKKAMIILIVIILIILLICTIQISGYDVFDIFRIGIEHDIGTDMFSDGIAGGERIGGNAIE